MTPILQLIFEASLLLSFVGATLLILTLKQINEKIKLQQLAMDNCNDLIWLKDQKGRIRYINQSMKRMIQRIPDNFGATTDAECLRLRKRCYFVEIGYTKRGERRTMSVIKTPLFKNGRYMGIVGCARFIYDDLHFLHREFETGNIRYLGGELFGEFYYRITETEKCNQEIIV